MAGILKLATAQFAVGPDIRLNLSKISEQIREAAKEGCELIHFSECCLTGYTGIDIKHCENANEIPLALTEISNLAKENSIWVIIGSHYFTDQSSKPLNSLFVYDHEGRLVAHYDKRVLAGAPGEMDQKHYSSGTNAVTFEINGIKCGLLICHEWRYPEFFREYRQLGIDLLFHSFYDGNISPDAYIAEGAELGELISGSERGNAANNYLWISVANTSKAEQAFPSMLLHPDGSIAGQAQRNKTQLVITQVSTGKKFIDPSRYGREKITKLFPEGILKSESAD